MSNTLGFGLDINRGGAGYKFQSETVTLLRALTGSYPAPRKIEIDKMIKSLKAAGIWAKLDVFQVYAALNAADAVINWKNPGTFNATLVNSPTFTADRGLTGTEAGGYIDTNFNPSTAGGNYAQDSALISHYSRTDSIHTTRDDWGTYESPKVAGMSSMRSVGTPAISYFAMNNDNFMDANGTLVTRSDGFFALARTAAANFTVYWNTATQTFTRTSSGIPNRTVQNKVSNSFSLRETSYLAIGGGINSTEYTALKSAVVTYLTYLGANV